MPKRPLPIAQEDIGDRYPVKDITKRVWMEGVCAGSPVYVVRFSECNMWDGHPLHRSEGGSSCAEWCVERFDRGTPMTLVQIVKVLHALAGQPPKEEKKTLAGFRLMFTGGEPFAAIDEELVAGLTSRGAAIAVETNGTVWEPWMAPLFIVLSPKLDLHEGGYIAVPPENVSEVRVVVPGVVEGFGWTDVKLDALFARYPKAVHFVQAQVPIFDDQGSNVFQLAEGSNTEVTDEFVEMQERVYDMHTRRCLSYIDARPEVRLAVPSHRLFPVTY